MKGYTSKTALENYILQSIDSSFDTQITSWIEAIEAFIDNYTGRNFIADETASIRIYDGNNGVEIIVDDFVSISKLEIGEEEATRQEVAATDYRVYPNNTTPKRKLQLKDSYFTGGFQNVRVTAKWGYSTACPADVTLAATVLLAGIVNFSNNSKGKVTSESIGRYSVTYDNDKGWADFKRAMMALDTYKKYTF